MVDKKNIDKDIEDIKSRYKTETEELKELKNKGEGDSDWSGYMLGLNLLVSILVCTGIGYLFDRFFNTGGLLLAIFIVLGFAAGIWQIWKGLDSDT